MSSRQDQRVIALFVLVADAFTLNDPRKNQHNSVILVNVIHALSYPFSTNAVPVLVRSQCQLRTGSLLFHINNPGSGPDKLVPTRFQLSTNYLLVQKQEPPTGGGIIVTYLLPKRKTLIKIIK